MRCEGYVDKYGNKISCFHTARETKIMCGKMIVIAKICNYCKHILSKENPEWVFSPGVWS